MNRLARTKGTMQTYVKNFGNFLHWVDTQEHNGIRCKGALDIMGEKPWWKLQERLRDFAAWESLRGCTGGTINVVMSGTTAVLAIFHPELRSASLADDREILKIKQAANKHNPTSRLPFIPWERLVFEDMYRQTTETDGDGIPVHGGRAFLVGAAAWAMFNLLARPGAIVPPDSNPKPTIFRDSAIAIKGIRYIMLSGADGGSKMGKKHARTDFVRPPLDGFWEFWRRTISVSKFGKVVPTLRVEDLFISSDCSGPGKEAIFDWDGPICQQEVNSNIRKFLRKRFKLSRREAARVMVRGARTGCASYLKSIGWTIEEIAAVCTHKNPSTTRTHYMKSNDGKRVKGKKVKTSDCVAGKPWLTQCLTDCPMRPPAESMEEAVLRMKQGVSIGVNPMQRSRDIAARTRAPFDPLATNMFDSLRKAVTIGDALRKTRVLKHSFGYSFCGQNYT